MCSVDAPEPQIIESPKPTFVRNPYLDELDNDVASADALRRGRSSLVIPTNGDGIGFEGRGGSGSATSGGIPNGNGRNPAGSSGGGLSIPGRGPRGNLGVPRNGPGGGSRSGGGRGRRR